MSFVKFFCRLKNIHFKFYLMKKILVKLPLAGVVAAALLFSSVFLSCTKNDSGYGGGVSSNYASTALKITDAAIDDAAVQGAFVTITDIQLDGQSVQGFNKTTVDLAAYQNGSTKTLGNFNLQGKTYTSITFVLDFATDASGNFPGCYVLNNSGVKSQLTSNSNIVTVTKGFSLVAGASNSIVADFDLRKLIIHQSGGSDHYNFVTSAEMQGAVRLVVENQTGTISGTLTDAVSGSGKVIVYAYKKGAFVRSQEVQGQGSSNIEFKNAVSSAVVNGSGYYQLHFLESGEYELHFAKYTDANADGEFDLTGTLIIIGAGTIDPLNIVVSSGLTLSLNATATGVLSL